MARFRSAIADFQLANPMYSGATVTFYVADENGAKTATVATLYRGATGAITVNNPVILDAEGKFSTPIFHDIPVVAEVIGATVGTHDTGPIAPRGTFKDDWVTATRYSTGDTVRDGTTGTIYLVPNDYTSAATIAADIAAENLILLIDSTRVGFLFRYSSTTTQADPGAGYFRFDNATISSVTAAVVDATSQASGNPDVSDALVAQKNNFDEATIVVYSQTYPDTVWAMFTATAVTDNTGYISYTLTYVDHAGSFTNGELCRWVQIAAGDNGFAFHAGSGAPSSGLGRNGDTYLDRATGTLYAKSSGSWAATAEQVFADAVSAAEDAQAAAEAAQTAAELAETNAEAARDAAFTNADVYADEATGRAAVSNGEQFSWIDGDDVVRSERVDASNSTEVARYPTTGTALLAADAPFSYIPQKSLDTAGPDNVEWVARKSLSETPSIAVAMETSGNRQMLISNYTNPTIRISTAVVSNKLRVTSALSAIFATGAATAYKALTDRTISGGGKSITVAVALSNLGFGPIFTGTAPTLGGSTDVMNSDAVFVVLRGNGALLAYDRSGTTVAGGVTVTPNSVITPFSAGQKITWNYQATSSTGGTLTFYADGSLLQTVTVSGLPSDGYVMNGIRWTGIGDVVELVDMNVVEASADVVKRVYLDPNNAGTPNGTETSPWLTLADAIDSYSVDSYRREVDLVLKAGVYRGALDFNADRWRRVRVRAAKGQGVIIRPSAALASGGAAWTQIGASEVWYTDHKWGLVTGSLLGLGGIVEVTSGVTQAFGRTGLVTLENRALYTRRSVGTADTSLARGDYTVHQSSTYAGKILVRCIDGGDPNDKDWEQITYRYGISCIGSANTAVNACDLLIQDITIEHPQTYGIWGRYINAILENVAVKGTGESFGFEFDECNVRAYGCLAEGTYADGFHSAGGLSSDANRRLPMHEYWDCESMGAFTSSLGGVGDGWSNHAGHIYYLYNSRAWSSGKDGLSAISRFHATDFDARDCVANGISLAPGADTTLELSRVSGGKFIGNTTGINLNFASNNNVVASLDVDRAHLEDNVRSSVETFSGGTGCSGEVVARNCTTRTTGSAPTEGHIKQAGLTITAVTGTALA